MKHLANETRNNIISLRDSGQSSHQIEVRIGVSRRTVDAIRGQARPAIQKNIGGRPAKLTEVNK